MRSCGTLGSGSAWAQPWHAAPLSETDQRQGPLPGGPQTGFCAVCQGNITVTYEPQPGIVPNGYRWWDRKHLEPGSNALVPLRDEDKETKEPR